MKILQYKLNAIMAKSRAIYGKRLTEKDYESLLNCSSVADIVSYLRGTAYYDVLSKTATSDISAGHLEYLIRKRKTEIFGRLSAYGNSFGQELHRCFIAEQEIGMILRCIRNILRNSSDEYSLLPSDSQYSYSEIDFYALMKASSVEELLFALDDTPYKKIIVNCLGSRDSEYIDYECALTDYLSEFEYKLVGKYCGRDSELMKLLSEKSDTEFIDRIYRMKKYFSASSERIVRSIVPVHLTNLTQKQIKAFVSSANEKEVIEVLKSTAYKEYAEGMKGAIYAEQAIARLNYEKYLHLLRFSDEPYTVMFCFMFLMENEVSNLVHIIEGIKYKMDAGSIKELLIGVGD